MATSRRVLAKAVATKIAAGANTAQIGQQLAAYLVLHKMTDQTEMLLGDIAYELAQQKQHLFATAKSAHPLTKELRAQIRDYLAKHYNVTQVELAEITDESLVGGLLIETPSETRDATIRAKLRRLQQA